MALMTVVGMGAVTVAAQETPTPVENETNATANETVAADNETEAIAEDNETEAITEDNETVVAGMNETANVTFGNQSTNGTFVVVNETVLPEGGFVAIFTVNESLAENVTNETAAGANVTTPTEEELNVTEAEGNETNETEVGIVENVTNETEVGVEENVTNETEVGMTPTPEAGANASVVSVDQINNSTLGMLVGNSTYLDPGTHEDVLVDYRSQIRQTNDQVLIAVAYRDTNDNQTFDGVENESAYVANGTIVADQAYITVEENVTANVTAAPAEEGLNETEAGLNETEAGLNETGEPMTPTPEEEGLNETGAALNETEEAATPTAAEEGLNETDGVENETGADGTPTPTPLE